MRPIRLLIAEDHRLMLSAVKRLFAREGDVEVVGEASTGPAVLPLVAATEPDVALLDIGLPGMTGLECLERIRRDHPGVRVVVLSAHGSDEYVARARIGGASGYVVKTAEGEELVEAVRSAASQAGDFVAFGVDDLRRGFEADELTEREVVVLEGVARGLSNKAIARELWITEQTVKFHLRNVYRKLGVANRVEAAQQAYRRGVAVLAGPAA